MGLDATFGPPEGEGGEAGPLASRAAGNNPHTHSDPERLPHKAPVHQGRRGRGRGGGGRLAPSPGPTTLRGTGEHQL